MAQVTVINGQSIFDIAIQVYGTIELVYKLIQDNPQILDIQTNITGYTLEYDDTITNDLTIYFKSNGIQLATGQGLYQEVSFNRSFDDSFDDSFL